MGRYCLLVHTKTQYVTPQDLPNLLVETLPHWRSILSHIPEVVEISEYTPLLPHEKSPYTKKLVGYLKSLATRRDEEDIGNLLPEKKGDLDISDLLNAFARCNYLKVIAACTLTDRIRKYEREKKLRKARVGLKSRNEMRSMSMQEVWKIDLLGYTLLIFMPDN